LQTPIFKAGYGLCRLLARKPSFVGEFEQTANRGAIVSAELKALPGGNCGEKGICQQRNRRYAPLTYWAV
jgi:hypothetical protein